MSFFKKKDKVSRTEDEIIAGVRPEFRMMIEDMFVIRGVGTIATGMVKAGMCRAGEPAVIIHNGKEIETEIIFIDFMGKEHKQDGVAYPNENVGLGLKGITQEQLEQKEIQLGDWIVVKNGQA